MSVGNGLTSYTHIDMEDATSFVLCSWQKWQSGVTTSFVSGESLVSKPTDETQADAAGGGGQVFAVWPVQQRRLQRETFERGRPAAEVQPRV